MKQQYVMHAFLKERILKSYKTNAYRKQGTIKCDIADLINSQTEFLEMKNKMIKIKTQ
jgi:hypothetical protein